ncbi:MAG TPA: hypothetical protein VJN22_04495, partial [Candidatus Eremiobacteraceae bacterium]|nr:hypothetical protein [Candidatus Eremiobacteraceae bacterium]
MVTCNRAIIVRPAAVAVVAALLAAFTLRADADQQQVPVGHAQIAIDADRVMYFSDAATIQARGHVHATLPDGSSLSADAFSMDLSLQRIIAAGHLRLHTASGDFTGAALADFLPFRRVYFVPLVPGADRWTFLNGDYAHPEKGREMPGDAFFLADFGSARPFIVAKSAIVDPSTFVRFAPAAFGLFNGTIRTPPLPPFVENFAPDPNFGVNALSGATYDVPYGFAGSTTSLDTLHLRYDQNRNTYASYEHHLVDPSGAYAVFSLNPATQPDKQWNLLGYAPLGDRAALDLTTQLFTFQSGLSQPLSANGFADLKLLRAMRHSSLTFELTPQYGNLLAPTPLGYYGDPSHTYTPNHPMTFGAAWSGFDEPLAKSGLSFRVQSGFGYDHDAFGIGKPHLQTITTEFAGASIQTPVYPGPFKSGLTAVYQVQRTWLSFPNVVDRATLALTDSRRLNKSLILLASGVFDSISTQDLGEVFSSPNATTGLTPSPQSNNGIANVGGVGIYPQFLGATNRAYALTTQFQPNAAFQMSMSLQQNTYSPLQTPVHFGPPRYQLSGDVRFKISKTMSLDVARSYFFNWGGLG